mmetsp:Transcript_12809/g.25005  ORF Transcript_12809/g.25005 Transcript_12809/m.25005 type:complete len:468 (-) Transcript_12809:194-1597(-)
MRVLIGPLCEDAGSLMESLGGGEVLKGGVAVVNDHVGVKHDECVLCLHHFQRPEFKKGRVNNQKGHLHLDINLLLLWDCSLFSRGERGGHKDLHLCLHSLSRCEDRQALLPSSTCRKPDAAVGRSVLFSLRRARAQSHGDGLHPLVGSLCLESEELLQELGSEVGQEGGHGGKGGDGLQQRTVEGQRGGEEDVHRAPSKTVRWDRAELKLRYRSFLLSVLVGGHSEGEDLSVIPRAHKHSQIGVSVERVLDGQLRNLSEVHLGFHQLGLEACGAEGSERCRLPFLQGLADISAPSREGLFRISHLCNHNVVLQSIHSQSALRRGCVLTRALQGEVPTRNHAVDVHAPALQQKRSDDLGTRDRLGGTPGGEDIGVVEVLVRRVGLLSLVQRLLGLQHRHLDFRVRRVCTCRGPGPLLDCGGDGEKTAREGLRGKEFKVRNVKGGPVDSRGHGLSHKLPCQALGLCSNE